MVFFELANKTPKGSAPPAYLIEIKNCSKSWLIGSLDIGRSTGHQPRKSLLGAAYFLCVFKRSRCDWQTALAGEGIKSSEEPSFIFSGYCDQF